MKIKYIFVLLLIILGGINTGYAYQQQGFVQYDEKTDGIKATCLQQCAIVTEEFSSYDSLLIHGTISGSGQLIRGFLINNQIISLGNKAINGSTDMDSILGLSDNPYYSQIPKNANVIVLFQGSISLEKTTIELQNKSFFEKWSSGITSASRYIPYSAKTINFLEGPLWNGIYINQSILGILVIWSIILCIIYFAFPHNKKKIIAIATILFSLGWLYIDFFSTLNQYRLYNQIMSNKENIMNNGRLAQGSDFYPFLEFVKNNVTDGEKGFFLAPYPYGFEGKYHIYPHIEIASLTGAKALIYYNSMGTSAKQFGFDDPVITEMTGENNTTIKKLIRNNTTIQIDKVLDRKPYAKIYFVK